MKDSAGGSEPHPPPRADLHVGPIGRWIEHGSSLPAPPACVDWCWEPPRAGGRVEAEGGVSEQLRLRPPAARMLTIANLARECA